MAVADSLALFVDQCFEAPGSFSSMHLTIGVIFYSFQIYCDFSGYSDIAIGLARIMGFDFPDNFRTPYFSRNFSEFWTRWHISLSSWLRDYLYIPLGGNRGGSISSYFFIFLFMILVSVMTGWWWVIALNGIIVALSYFYMKQGDQQKIIVFTYMNLMVTMLLGGLWHGASWAFVFWGFLHGAYLVIQRLVGPYFGKFMDAIHSPKFIKDGVNIALVYFFTCLAWIYFRSPDFGVATQVIERISSLENFNFSSVINKFVVIKGFLLIGMLLVVEIADFKFNFSDLIIRKPVFRVVSFAAILWLIAFFGTFGASAFIYFQF